MQSKPALEINVVPLIHGRTPFELGYGASSRNPNFSVGINPIEYAPSAAISRRLYRLPEGPDQLVVGGSHFLGRNRRPDGRHTPIVRPPVTVQPPVKVGALPQAGAGAFPGQATVLADNRMKGPPGTTPSPGPMTTPGTPTAVKVVLGVVALFFLFSWGSGEAAAA